MRVTLVHVQVQPEHVEPFVTATIRNHEGSVREPGNVRFDVLQSEDDPARFILVEIYGDDQAVNAHRTTAHYQAWRDLVAPWMATPRESRHYRLLAPAPASLR